MDRRLYDDLCSLIAYRMGETGDSPEEVSAVEQHSEEPLRILEPVRTESGAFKALCWVVGCCLLVIAVAVIARAL